MGAHAGRQVVRLPTAVLIFVTFAAPAACQHDRTDPGPVSETLEYAFQQADGRDTLKQVLVARQRRMFASVLNSSRTDLADFIDVRFTWRTRKPARAQHSYFAVLAGHHPASLIDVPDAYLVQLQTDTTAQVYAALPDGNEGILTAWRWRNGEWRALWSDEVEFGLDEWESRMQEIEQIRNAPRRPARPRAP